MNTQAYRPEGFVSAGADIREFYYSKNTLE